jgi:hypothetical protein
MTVGLYEKGLYVSKVSGVHTPEYRKWKMMFYRCYDSKFKASAETYQGCEVGQAFHRFQNFAEWCNNQAGFKEGFQLDKDILVKGNKIYSPETCVFVPHEINSLLTKADKMRGDLPVGVSWHSRDQVFTVKINTANGAKHVGYFSNVSDAFEAYKVTKEKHIQRVAEKYVDVIDRRCYDALMNYKVEVTD